jgi:predicted methyltransferase
MRTTNIKEVYQSFLRCCLTLFFISSVVAVAQPVMDNNAMIQSPIRTEQDRAMDAKRKPMEMLQLIQAKSGMQVLDLFSGAGYTAQLMALAVGPSGKVIAMNTKPNEALLKRLEAHPQSNLMPVISSLTELLPGQQAEFDLVTIVNSYHDMVNLNPDIMVTNKRIYELLKPSGVLIVRDHAALEGTGKSATKTLHRIDPAAVVADFQAVGFRQVAEGNFLKSPHDPKTEHSYRMGDIPPEGFVFKFVK